MSRPSSIGAYLYRVARKYAVNYSPLFWGIPQKIIAVPMALMKKLFRQIKRIYSIYLDNYILFISKKMF